VSSNEIELRVVEEDGLSYAVDALVLKHAQALYGLDAKVVARTGLDLALLPKPDAYRKFPGRPHVAAQTVFFVGTRAVDEFSYSDIRRFGYKALCSVASALPGVTEVALTLHGVGYGLDEVECFDAEIAGLLDAIGSRDIPRTLTTITFLEVNPGRAARMRTRLASLVGPGTSTVSGAGPASTIARTSRETLRAVGTQTGSRAHAFVAMPFEDSFSDVFHYGLANAVRANGLLCERIDNQAFVGDIVERLKEHIRSARIVIADVTNANPNVFLEVGFAWGHGVPTILVCREGSELRFDIQSQRCIFYDSIRDLEQKLKTDLAQILTQL
jgi:hypothetical protein